MQARHAARPAHKLHDVRVAQALHDRYLLPELLQHLQGGRGGTGARSGRVGSLRGRGEVEGHASLARPAAAGPPRLRQAGRQVSGSRSSTELCARRRTCGDTSWSSSRFTATSVCRQMPRKTSPKLRGGRRVVGGAGQLGGKAARSWQACALQRPAGTDATCLRAARRPHLPMPMRGPSTISSGWISHSSRPSSTMPAGPCERRARRPWATGGDQCRLCNTPASVAAVLASTPRAPHMQWSRVQGRRSRQCQVRGQARPNSVRRWQAEQRRLTRHAGERLGGVGVHAVGVVRGARGGQGGAVRGAAHAAGAAGRRLHGRQRQCAARGHGFQAVCKGRAGVVAGDARQTGGSKHVALRDGLPAKGSNAASVAAAVAALQGDWRPCGGGGADACGDRAPQGPQLPPLDRHRHARRACAQHSGDRAAARLSGASELRREARGWPARGCRLAGCTSPGMCRAAGVSAAQDQQCAGSCRCQRAGRPHCRT